MLYLYFFLFYILGIVLWITRKYDLITISIVFAIFGLFIGFGNLIAFIYLLIFFSAAEGITLILDKKHEKRTYKNLIGNCLPACLFISFGMYVPAVTCICASFSDTMSSEIGRLSKIKPRLITTFKSVKKGTDGGVTLLGLLAAAIVAVSTIIYFFITPNILNLTQLLSLKEILIIGLAGFSGTLIDSVIGATLEQKGYSNNYQTNFIASLLAGLVALLFLNIL